jgi:ketosteroid isomerase-like protein
MRDGALEFGQSAVIYRGEMRCSAAIFCWSVLALGCLVPASAQDHNVPQYAAVPAATTLGTQTNTQLIHDVLLKLVDRWNAHDIEGLMSLYWNSPNLLAVIEGEQYEGWESLYHSCKRQYRGPSDMGTVSPTRIQVELLKPDLAFGILSWTLRYPNNPRASEIVGTSTVDLQKFDDGWKIVVLHTSFTEM